MGTVLLYLRTENTSITVSALWENSRKFPYLHLLFLDLWHVYLPTSQPYSLFWPQFSLNPHPPLFKHIFSRAFLPRANQTMTPLENSHLVFSNTNSPLLAILDLAAIQCTHLHEYRYDPDERIPSKWANESEKRMTLSQGIIESGRCEKSTTWPLPL